MRTFLTTIVVIIAVIDLGTNAQEDFDVRLAGGRDAFEGRVEVFLQGEWGTICDDGWDFLDATTVCQQLGHSWALLVTHSAQFGQGDGPVRLTSVACRSFHYHLKDCEYSRTVGSCDHRQDAGVVCHGDAVEGPPVFELYFEGQSATPGGTILLDIEYITKYSVCTDGWDLDDATIACRHENQGVATADVNPRNTVTVLFQEQFLTDVRCTGSEEHLHECPVTIVSNCTSGRAAGVTCSGPDLTNYPLRLTGSDRFLEGRVEVYFNNAWGTVCDDGWNIDDATVVCRQLGYGDALSAVQGAFYGGSVTGDIVFDDVECRGSESHLFQCKLKLNHNCDHSEDAGVKCSGLLWGSQNAEYSDGDIRLVDEYGPTKRAGVIELYHKSKWNRICRRSGWSQNAANVACHQLGYSKAASYGAKDIPATKTGYLDPDPMMTPSDCVGDEPWLLGCLFVLTPEGVSDFLVPECDEPQYAMVECEGMPENGDLQLVSTSDLGIKNVVQVYHDGVWGTICSDGWTKANSDVVCDILNLGSSLSYEDQFYASDSLLVRGPILMGNVTCNGYEVSFLDCSLEDWGSSPTICSHKQDISVTCSVGAGMSAVIGVVITSALAAALTVSNSAV